MPSSKSPGRRDSNADHNTNGSAAKAATTLPADESSGFPPRSLDDPKWQAEFFMQRRLERARIPQRFLNKSLESFKTPNKEYKELVNAARAYIAQFNFKQEYPRGLLMMGNVGCGKSHLAVAILRGVIGKGYSGLYYNSPDLMRDIRATFVKDSEVSEDDLLEEVTTTDLLVFDDVGAENVTGFVLDRFYLIINERYEGCKPVIITTNLDVETMSNRLGKRILSRIWEMCETFGPFPETDWRMRNMR